VLFRLVGDAVLPAPVDDAGPGSGEDADGMGVVFAGCSCVGVDAGGPRAGVPAVVGVDRHRLAEALVACPAEADGSMLAGLLRDRAEAGQRGDGVR
jgi:hypothetical protein